MSSCLPSCSDIGTFSRWHIVRQKNLNGQDNVANPSGSPNSGMVCWKLPKHFKHFGKVMVLLRTLLLETVWSHQQGNYSVIQFFLLDCAFVAQFFRMGEAVKLWWMHLSQQRSDTISSPNRLLRVGWVYWWKMYYSYIDILFRAQLFFSTTYATSSQTPYAYTCIHHRIQLAVGDMTMSGWKPTISLIHPPTLITDSITQGCSLPQLCV